MRNMRKKFGAVQPHEPVLLRSSGTRQPAIESETGNDAGIHPQDAGRTFARCNYHCVERGRMTKSAIEATFALHCKAHGLAPEREYKFHPARKWRFDYCWPDRKIAVELEGGIWTNGRHNRGAGMIGDMEKYNEAAKLGWFVFRFDVGAVQRGEAIEFIRGVLNA